MEEALRWYAVIGDACSPYYDYHYTGLAYLRSAEVHEQLGDVESAVLEYSRFTRLWRDCDPELRPLVEAAQRAIEALSPDA